MSFTTTPRLGLVKPTPGTGEGVNVQTQINDAWTLIDGVIGATICTSGTRPSAPFHGQFIRETDTREVRVWNATQAHWDQILTEFNGGVTVCTESTRPGSPTDGQMILETDTERMYMYNGGSWRQIFAQGSPYWTAGMGATAALQVYTPGLASMNRAISTRGAADTTDDRWCVDYDGSMQWGVGTSAMDVGLSRGGAGYLEVNGGLSANGVAAPQRAFNSGNPTWTGSTTYTNSPGGGGNLFGVTFVAPPSGTVMVTVEGWVGNNSTTIGRRAYLGFEVRSGSSIGSGTLTGGAVSDDRAGVSNIPNAGAAGFKYAYICVNDLFFGLTPGSTYNVTTLVRIDNAADTGAAFKRKILVMPSVIVG